MAAQLLTFSLELHGAADPATMEEAYAGRATATLKKQLRVRPNTSVLQIMQLIRQRHYPALSPEEALFIFVRRADNTGRTSETVPKITATAAELHPAEFVVTRESVFGVSEE